MRNNPARHRLPIFDRSGVLLVNKPTEWTSHDIVAFVRSRFNVPKVGHCGTLDPAATGLLVVVLGKFTKLSQKFSGEDKVYEGTILLGRETDSQDMDGNVIRESDPSGVTEQMLRDTFGGFVGDIEQIPPMVSAVKKGESVFTSLRARGRRSSVKRNRSRFIPSRWTGLNCPTPILRFPVPREPISAPSARMSARSSDAGRACTA